jgi:SAM-dependent methyltransferase
MKPEIDPKVLGQQLMKPTGDIGKDVGLIMNNTNAALYELAFSLLDLNEATSLLEIGFGNGLFFPRFIALAPHIKLAGTDFSEVMCREAAQRNADLVAAQRLDLRCEDSQKMSFAAGSFDWVLGLNTLYFWEEPHAHLSEIARVLKPKGHLLLGYRPKSAMVRSPFAQECFRLFEPSEIRALLESAGFDVEVEKTKEVQRVSADGKIVSSTDICVVARKAQA